MQQMLIVISIKDYTQNYFHFSGLYCLKYKHFSLHKFNSRRKKKFFSSNVIPLRYPLSQSAGEKTKNTSKPKNILLVIKYRVPIYNLNIKHFCFISSTHGLKKKKKKKANAPKNTHFNTLRLRYHISLDMKGLLGAVSVQ